MDPSHTIKIHICYHLISSKSSFGQSHTTKILFFISISYHQIHLWIHFISTNSTFAFISHHQNPFVGPSHTTKIEFWIHLTPSKYNFSKSISYHHNPVWVHLITPKSISYHVNWCTRNGLLYQWFCDLTSFLLTTSSNQTWHQHPQLQGWLANGKKVAVTTKIKRSNIPTHIPGH